MAKIIQIATSEKGLIALCDDGSLWQTSTYPSGMLSGSWAKQPTPMDHSNPVSEPNEIAGGDPGEDMLEEDNPNPRLNNRVGQ